MIGRQHLMHYKQNEEPHSVVLFALWSSGTWVTVTKSVAAPQNLLFVKSSHIQIYDVLGKVVATRYGYVIFAHR